MKKYIIYNKVGNYFTIMSEKRKNRIEKNFGKSTTDGKVYEYSASLERFMTENGFIVVTDEIEEKARELVLNIKNYSSIVERKKPESLKNFLGIGKKI